MSPQYFTCGMCSKLFTSCITMNNKWVLILFLTKNIFILGFSCWIEVASMHLFPTWLRFPRQVKLLLIFLPKKFLNISEKTKNDNLKNVICWLLRGIRSFVVFVVETKLSRQLQVCNSRQNMAKFIWLMKDVMIGLVFMQELKFFSFQCCYKFFEIVNCAWGLRVW